MFALILLLLLAQFKCSCTKNVPSTALIVCAAANKFNPKWLIDDFKKFTTQTNIMQNQMSNYSAIWQRKKTLSLHLKSNIFFNDCLKISYGDYNGNYSTLYYGLSTLFFFASVRVCVWVCMVRSFTSKLAFASKLLYRCHLVRPSNSNSTVSPSVYLPLLNAQLYFFLSIYMHQAHFRCTCIESTLFFAYDMKLTTTKVASGMTKYPVRLNYIPCLF